MWLLDHAGDTFQGRRLWLRPGKRYLFGRTRAEPGQLVISDKTISRKHLTIEVGPVTPGDGAKRDSRSVVTIEDLSTKIGTIVNGTQIRGQKFVLIQDANEIKMGHMSSLFRITWKPVVLSFSFTTKELRADPWPRLRDQLEQLDVKYIADYDISLTTHVVAKKRNTSKGLQALINGRFIVTENFVSAIAEAAAAENGGLEQDFDQYWPNALEHLPARGDEPSDRPVSTYGPDERRQEIFDGYTFIFYDEKQYENLFPPITNGKGKALLSEVVPGQTEVDDFVRYVKSVAGDQNLGEFEDGGEGKGVVVVRYLPAKGDHVEWFARFSRAVSLRLDHRLIDQREFLDAILAVEPGMLRRSLEEETGTPTAIPPAGASKMDIDQSGSASQVSENATSTTQSVVLPTRKGGRTRRGLTSRFKGFDVDLDIDGPSLVEIVEKEPEKPAQPAEPEETSMFMSQTRASEEPAEPEPVASRVRARKRTVTAVVEEEEDVMVKIAPTAAAVKRRRIEAGVDPIPPRQSPDVEEEEEEENAASAGSKTKGRGGKKVEENSILEQARKNREAAEKRAADEKAELAQIPDDGIDAEEIRKLTIVEEISVRAPTAPRTRDQDIANGRWDPSWNGRRNFKKFRKQGDPAGRPVRRVIVELEPVKTKEYGIGDDYWLEGEDTNSWKQSESNGSRRGQQPQVLMDMDSTDGTAPSLATTRSRGLRISSLGSNGGRVDSLPSVVGVSDGSGDEGTGIGTSIGPGGGTGPEDVEMVPDTEPEDEPAPPSEDLPRTRAGKAAQKTATRMQTRARGRMPSETPLDTPSQSDLQTQSAVQTQTTRSTRSKRTAPASGSGSRASPAKKTRRGAAGAITIRDSDSEDDGLQFKFRSRR